MIRTLIFENNLSGHRANYVQLLANELLRLECQVTLALPESAVDSAEGKTFLESLLEHVELVSLPDTGPVSSVRKHSQKRFRLLQQCVVQAKPDHVYVPYADGITQAWGMHAIPRNCFPNGIILEGLMMRGAFAYPARSLKERLKNELGWRLQRRSAWDCLHQLDPLVLQCIQNRDAEFAKRVRLIPDPVEKIRVTNRNAACRSLGLPTNSFVVTCPGAVKESKGVDRLIQAVDSLQLRQPVLLALHGKHSDRIIQLLDNVKHPSRFHSVNRFASAAEFEALFAAADLIAVCYPRHIGSASILLRAANAEKRIVCSNWGWIGWVSEHFGIGTRCDATNSRDIARKLQGLMENSGAVTNANPAREAFLNYHSTTNHVGHWTRLLCERNNLRPSKRLPFPALGESTS